MFLEKCFYYKPIKTKHITFTDRGNKGKLSQPNDQVSLPFMWEMQFAVTYENVGYTFILMIFANLQTTAKEPKSLVL